MEWMEWIHNLKKMTCCVLLFHRAIKTVLPKVVIILRTGSSFKLLRFIHPNGIKIAPRRF